jgi:hypothetical protein
MIMRFLVLLSAALLVPSFLSAQTPTADTDPCWQGGLSATHLSGPRALGDVVAGPFDVETAPFDNRCLGVEEAWDHLWVTGRGHSTVGDVYMIHKFDLNGVYVASYPQNVSAPNIGGWGGRDMESDEPGNLLWVGNDNGHVEVMSFDPVTGGLLYQSTVVTSVPGTVRALCQDPGSGNFFTKSFGGDLFEFDLASGLVVNSWVNAAPSAYGFGWDAVNGTIWSTDAGAAATEVDPASGQLTGRSFPTTLGGSQGGADVYVDARNPGTLSLVMLHQATPDSVVVYDLGDPAAPVLTVTNLIGGQVATMTVTGATPFACILFGWSCAGGGPTWTPYGDLMLSPHIYYKGVRADASGTSSHSGLVPGWKTGRTMYFHAFDNTAKVFSNPVNQVVG